MIVPLLLCAGMLVIPLVALAGTERGTAVVHVAAGKVAAGNLVGPVAPAGADPMVPAAPPDSAVPTTGTPQVTVLTAAATDPTAASPGGAPAVPHAATAAAAPVRPATTTTTEPRPAPTSPPTTRSAPTTTAPPAPQHSQSGQASYYNAPNGTCAHPTLPFGTVVSITDTDNGNRATCTVEDRGPYVGGRIIDLAENVFAQLAPMSQGVADVRISW